MRKYLIPMIVLVLVVGLVVVATLLPNKTTPVVAVVTYGDHYVLNTIEQAFTETLMQDTQHSPVKLVPSSAQGRIENIPDLARQVLLQHPSLVVTLSTPVTKGLMQKADSQQRIVYTFVTNPGDLGDDLTRTNSTGLSDAVNYAGNIALIRSIFGESVTIGIVYNPNEDNSQHAIATIENLLRDSSTRLVKATVTRENDVPATVAALVDSVDVIYVGGDNTVVQAIVAVVNAALESRTPVFASDLGSVQNGAIGGVSVDYAELGRDTARVVKEVLDGREPRDIPRRTLHGNQLVINLTAAKRFQFEIPAEIVQKADIVIDTHDDGG